MDEKLDRTTTGVRFGCGALFGVACGLFIVMRTFEPISTGIIVAAFVALMIIFGALATRFGDRFWYAILDRRF